MTATDSRYWTQRGRACVRACVCVCACVRACCLCVCVCVCVRACVYDSKGACLPLEACGIRQALLLPLQIRASFPKLVRTLLLLRRRG